MGTETTNKNRFELEETKRSCRGALAAGPHARCTSIAVRVDDDWRARELVEVFQVHDRESLRVVKSSFCRATLGCVRSCANQQLQMEDERRRAVVVVLERRWAVDTVKNLL